MPVLDMTSIDTSAFSNVTTRGVGTALKTVLAELDSLATVVSRFYALYDAVVGSAAYCTDASISAAVSRVSAGARILVVEDQALNTTVTVSKANLRIELKGGVTVSKGTATTGFSVTASGFEMCGGRVTGFAAAGNKALNFSALATYGKVWGVRFLNNDTDIDDSLADVAQWGNINE
jgi:hypothetical protein